MEYVEGKSLFDLMKFRRRRFSIRQVIKFSSEISKLIKKIHQAGWIWNDCKPSNLIVAKIIRFVRLILKVRIKSIKPRHLNGGRKHLQKFVKILKNRAAQELIYMRLAQLFIIC